MPPLFCLLTISGVRHSDTLPASLSGLPPSQAKHADPHNSELVPRFAGGPYPAPRLLLIHQCQRRCKPTLVADRDPAGSAREPTAFATMPQAVSGRAPFRAP